MITSKESFRDITFNNIIPFKIRSIKHIDNKSFIVTINTSFNNKLKMIDKVFYKFGFIKIQKFYII